MRTLWCTALLAACAVSACGSAPLEPSTRERFVLGPRVELAPANRLPEMCPAVELSRGTSGALLVVRAGCDSHERVLAARLDTAGMPLDTETFPLFEPGTSLALTHVPLGDGSWLVGRLAFSSTGVEELQARRVSLDGEVSATTLDGRILAAAPRPEGALLLLAGTPDPSSPIPRGCGAAHPPCAFFLRELGAGTSLSARVPVPGIDARGELVGTMGVSLGASTGAALFADERRFLLHRFGTDGGALGDDVAASERAPAELVTGAAVRGDEHAFVIADASAASSLRLIVVREDGAVVTGPSFPASGRPLPGSGGTEGLFASDGGWIIRVHAPEGIEQHELDAEGAPVAPGAVIPLAPGEVRASPSDVGARPSTDDEGGVDGALVRSSDLTAEARVALEPRLADWTSVVAVATEDGGRVVYADRAGVGHFVRFYADGRAPDAPREIGAAAQPVTLIRAGDGFWLANYQEVVALDADGEVRRRTAIEEQMDGLFWTGAGGFARLIDQRVVQLDADGRPMGAPIGVQGVLRAASDGAVIAIATDGARLLSPTGLPVDDAPVALPLPVGSVWACGASCWYVHACTAGSGALVRLEVSASRLVMVSSAPTDLPCSERLEATSDPEVVVRVPATSLSDATRGPALFDLAGSELASTASSSTRQATTLWLATPHAQRWWLVHTPLAVEDPAGPISIRALDVSP